MLGFFYRISLALYFSNRIVLFTKYNCAPVFHIRNLDSFYLNTNLNDMSKIDQGI